MIEQRTFRVGGVRVGISVGGTPFGGARERGLGMVWRRGSLGTTYGDPRESLFADIVLWVGRPVTLSFCWKGAS